MRQLSKMYTSFQFRLIYRTIPTPFSRSVLFQVRFSRKTYFRKKRYNNIEKGRGGGVWEGGRGVEGMFMSGINILKRETFVCLKTMFSSRLKYRYEVYKLPQSDFPLIC